jgi:hypothetical protein
MLKQTLRASLMNEGSILTNEQMGFVKGGGKKYKKSSKKSKKSKKSGGSGSGKGYGGGGHRPHRGGHSSKCGW